MWYDCQQKQLHATMLYAIIIVNHMVYNDDKPVTYSRPYK